MKFSVIIPVYNDADALELLLPELMNQTYNSTEFEVFVVDNCSSENIATVVHKFTGVNYLKECENPGSPYSCRNRGIEMAKGETIALLDATCIPVPNWLEEAAKYFELENTDMLAGDVGFRFKNNKPNSAEFIDSITNIRMKESVLEKNVAKTANLFVRRELFDRLGMFEEGLRSGGDVRWTQKATSAGYTLGFSEKAAVKKEARSFFPLIYKQFRVGKGQAIIWAEKNLKKSKIKLFALVFFPINPKQYRQFLKGKGGHSTKYFWRIYFTANLMRASQRLGNFVGNLKS